MSIAYMEAGTPEGVTPFHISPGYIYKKYYPLLLFHRNYPRLDPIKRESSFDFGGNIVYIYIIMIILNIDKELHKQFKARVSLEGRTMRSVINDFIVSYVGKYQSETPLVERPKFLGASDTEEGIFFDKEKKLRPVPLDVDERAEL